jgi:outer membrane protein OmpA-like peptidoglycan-associated protein
MGDAAIHRAEVSEARVLIDSLAIVDEPLFWDGHPALTPDGRWIIFASDRKGSLGGSDLWYAPFTAGVAGAARPLYGANSPCDELSPFVTTQGRLFFSSAGHTSHGGYDIHEAELLQASDSLRVASVINAGLPINSPADEIFPVQLPDSVFYVASTRTSGRTPERRDFDIWVLHRSPSFDAPGVVAEIDPFAAGAATFTGKVINTKTNRPVVDAEVLARLPESTTVLSRTRTDTSGTYRLRVPVERQVEITAQDSKLFFDNIVTVVPASERNTIVESKKPLGLSSTFVLRVNFPTSVFDDPYPFSLDSNGIELERSWKRDVQDLITNVKASGGTIRTLILTGHTDDVDTDDDNMELGRKRVEFIIDRLVEGGLPRELLEGRSRGERDLLARRPGESTETWRKRCRRVELIKVQ